MKKNNFTVYAHLFPNGKYYIGITCQKPESRWGNEGQKYFNNNQLKMNRAIKKYGWDNIKHLILFSNLSEEEAKEKEKELIQKYNSYKNGYNATLGGDGSFGRKCSKKTKQKLRNYHLGKKVSKEAREKMSKSQIKIRSSLTPEERKEIFGRNGRKNGMYGTHRVGKLNPFYGKKHSTETKEKISKSNTGRISKQRKPVLQYDKNMVLIAEHQSIAIASKK